MVDKSEDDDKCADPAGEICRERIALAPHAFTSRASAYPLNARRSLTPANKRVFPLHAPIGASPRGREVGGGDIYIQNCISARACSHSPWPYFSRSLATSLPTSVPAGPRGMRYGSVHDSKKALMQFCCNCAKAKGWPEFDADACRQCKERAAKK